MGYLQTITVYKDAQHRFEESPKEFAEALFEGMHRANASHKETSAGFMGYANYISVQPCRHADDTTVYLHYGNGVYNLNPYNEDFKDLLESNPELAEKFVGIAQDILKMATNKIKDKKKKSK